jgi:hypothetical protein
MSRLNNCAWDSTTIGDVAKAISVEFYMLRFDELIHVFRAGPKGTFTKDGKVTFGALQHKDLAAWLTYYQENQRIEAEEEYRKKQQTDFAADHIHKVLPTDFISKIVHKMQAKGIDEAKTNKPAPTKEFLDDQHWTLFVQSKTKIKFFELKKLSEWAKQSELSKLHEATEEEIKRRENLTISEQEAKEMNELLVSSDWKTVLAKYSLYPKFKIKRAVSDHINREIEQHRAQTKNG